MPHLTGFQDFVSLVGGCVAWNLAFDRKAFLSGVFLGALLGAGSWLVCALSTRLWNRRYHMSAAHHALCAGAAALAALLTVGFVGVGNLGEVAKLSVKAWRLQLELESAAGWREVALQRVREELRELTSDRFSMVSPAGHSTAPASRAPSLEASVDAWAEEAARNFEYHRPFLSQILWAHRDIPREWVAAGARGLASGGDSTAAVSVRAFDLAADWIQRDLERQAPQVVTLTRFSLVLLFLASELIPFGLVGYGAYKDLRPVT